MEIITGVERRRRWSVEEKLRIVAETEQPGFGIAEVARRYEISRGLLWNWRSQVRRGVLRPESPPVFLPVQAIKDPANGDGARAYRVLDILRGEFVASAEALDAPVAEAHVRRLAREREIEEDLPLRADEGLRRRLFRSRGARREQREAGGEGREAE